MRDLTYLMSLPRGRDYIWRFGMEVVRGSFVLRVVVPNGITGKGLAARWTLLPRFTDHMRRTPIGSRYGCLYIMSVT